MASTSSPSRTSATMPLWTPHRVCRLTRSPSTNKSLGAISNRPSSVIAHPSLRLVVGAPAAGLDPRAHVGVADADVLAEPDAGEPAVLGGGVQPRFGHPHPSCRL